MEILSLNGAWQVRSSEKNSESIPAKVPGLIHTDLINAGKIEDPFYRDNELDVKWIEDKNWIYTREFDVDKEFLKNERVLLRCKGLDTLTKIKINGKLIGLTDNMFRSYEFDAKALLKNGRNKIEIRFNSVFPYLEKKQREHKYPARHEVLQPVGFNKRDSGSWIRKEQCNFGWDWGPALVTCGIWKDIELAAFSNARIADVEIRQTHANKKAKLDIAISLEKGGGSKLSAKIYVSFKGKDLQAETIDIKGKKGAATFDIDNPELWWPNGLGEANLYDVKVELFDKSSELLDSAAKRIGLRTMKLVREKDEWGESFCFAANGIKFYVKGANWIPADSFITRMTRERYKKLIGSAVEANMNMLRIWGGGIYENDDFYELCDEMGICVWQDFMFACTEYPAFDKEFMDNVRIEAEQNVKRLRHHPCISFWCGNNELEQGHVKEEWSGWAMNWKDYGELFDKLLRKIVEELNPETSYWPGSPHTPMGDRCDYNNAESGDAHLWSVWHGRQPFEWYRESEPRRFVSEFGFQSFPEPKTVYAYTEEKDRNITSWVMDHHQRAPIGNAAIMSYMHDWFKMPKDFDSVLWASQILQGMAITYATEAWRRAPQCMGSIYWQLNDCWPVASWSSIDYYGRWKAQNYMAKRFYAPLLVSGVEDWKKSSVDIFATSDLHGNTACEAKWTLTDVDGNVLTEGAKSVKIQYGKTRKVETLDLSKYAKNLHGRNLMLWLELTREGKTESSNLVTLYKPKSIELRTPAITAKICEESDGSFSAALSSDKPAMWVWLELENFDAVFSDNFFHMRPGRNLSITLKPDKKLNLKQVEKGLIIRSLRSLY